MDPLPSWVSWFDLAREIGVPVTELPDVDPYLIGAAAALLHAKSLVAEEQERRQAERGR